MDLEVWEGEEREGDDVVKKYGKRAEKKNEEVEEASEASGRISGVKKELLNW